VLERAVLRQALELRKAAGLISSRSARRAAVTPGRPSGKPHRLAPRPAALHVYDLAVADRQHLEPLDPAPAREPARRADHFVADDGEVRLHAGARRAALLDLELENLTGLVGASSG